jgi:cytidylate kinase
MEYDYVPTDLLERATRRFELQAHAMRGRKKSKGRVIAISRLFGAGADEVVPMVGKQLDWMVWDRQILDLLASETHNHYLARMFKTLDEKAQNWIKEMRAMFANVDPEEVYVRLLPGTLCTIAAQDSIIVGRASHLFLQDSLRVLIKAPREKRIEYVREKLDMTRSEAEKEIRHQDRNRQGFLNKIARHYIFVERRYKDEMHFDVEVNTGSLSFEGAADIIACSARSKLGE